MSICLLQYVLGNNNYITGSLRGIRRVLQHFRSSDFHKVWSLFDGLIRTCYSTVFPNKKNMFLPSLMSLDSIKEKIFCWRWIVVLLRVQAYCIYIKRWWDRSIKAIKGQNLTVRLRKFYNHTRCFKNTFECSYLWRKFSV